MRLRGGKRPPSLPSVMGLTLLLLAGGACGDDPSTRPTPQAGPTGSSGASPVGSPGASPTGAFTGPLLVWAEDTRADEIRPIAEQFAEENGVAVEVQEIALGTIGESLRQLGSAGEGPDVLAGPHDLLGELVPEGALTAVDGSGREEEFLDVAIEAFTMDGLLYGTPYGLESVALIRNTDLVPEPPKTWEDVERISLDLQEQGKVDIPLGMEVPNSYHQFPLFTGAGGYLFGRDGDGSFDTSDVGLDSEGGLHAAELFDGWTKSGLIDPSVTYDVMVEAFGGGRAPFAITGPWALTQEQTGFRATGVPYAVEAVPPVEGGTAAPLVRVQGFMVSSFSENPEVAEAFAADFATREEVQTALSDSMQRLPAHRASFEQAAASAPDAGGFAESAERGIPIPAVPGMESVWPVWDAAYGQIFAQQGDAKAAFQTAAAQIRTLFGA
jgi:arabinogalactan oligomer / maltooligosaccharide transport system substrate-binding protein